jgi:hypothetical protein
MATVKLRGNKFIVTCEGCDSRTSPLDRGMYAALKKALSRDGWRFRLLDGELVELCPLCIETFDANVEPVESIATSPEVTHAERAANIQAMIDDE